MGYDFSGIITNSTDERILKAASELWKFIRVKPINAPFRGIAIINHVTETFGREDNSEYEKDFDKREENKYHLEDETSSFSKEFPDAIFLFIVVECWGGQCTYAGTVYKNGSVLGHTGEDPISSSDNNLKVLLAHFNCRLNDNNYFEPFTRGYFEK